MLTITPSNVFGGCDSLRTQAETRLRLQNSAPNVEEGFKVVGMMIYLTIP